MLGDRQLDVLFPSPGNLNPEDLERYGIQDRVHDAFRNAGVMPGLAQLNREELYRLLLEVPQLSPDGKAGRALCRWFVSNDSFVFGSAGPYQERFMREGTIWGAKNSVSGYYPIKELRHVDSEGYPSALTAKLAIADLPKRVGAPKVKAVLGIKPLEFSEIKPELISHRASPETDNRADWFNKAKSFIKRLRQSQTKQAQAMGLFDRLALIVCDELEVRMQYEQTTYNHSALEGDFFIFADRLYVRCDLDDSLDLLADTVGTAVASVFDMADGDAFAKILRCDPPSRSKLLKRMCGDAFHEEIEEAKINASPKYSGPILEQSEGAPPDAADQAPEQEPASEAKAGEQEKTGEEKPAPGVVSIPHDPQPPTAPRRIVIQNVQKTAKKPSGAKAVVDGGRCERMAQALDEETQRHIREGLSEHELALYDLLRKDDISKADRERLKQASRELLAALRERLTTMPNWTKNATTQADVKILVLDTLYQSLPRPPFTEEETEVLADRLYGFIWQRSEAGSLFTEAA